MTRPFVAVLRLRHRVHRRRRASSESRRAPRLSLDDDPTNDERHFHISSRYIKFDHPSSSVPFLKKSGYQRAALPAAATIRLSPRTRRFVSRGQFIFLCEADTYCNRRAGARRSDIERDDKKREPRHYGAPTGYYFRTILSPPIVKRGSVRDLPAKNNVISRARMTVYKFSERRRRKDR